MGHLVWEYYTGDKSSSLSGDDGRSGSSALRDAKRIYEEMARTIEVGNHVTKNEYSSNSNTTVTPDPTYSSSISNLPVLVENNHTTYETEDMQQELETYMETLT